MSRKLAVAGPTISLFPFLAVLLCTMGALLVVLVLFSRSVKQNEAAKLDQESEELSAELEIARDSLAWRRDQLAGVRERTAEELAKARMQLAGIEENTRDLQDELAKLERTAAALASENGAVAVDDDTLRSLEERLKSTRESLDKAREGRDTKPPAYAVVPYEGRHGTHRRPLYIECCGDGVFLQPEGIRLSPGDFEGPPGPGNPLASALRAAREHIVAAQGGTNDPAAQPYPLLLVRPSGVMAYYAAREAIQSWGSEFGYQLIDEDWTLTFPPSDPMLAQVEKRAIEESRARLAWLAEVRPARPVRPPQQYRAAPTRGGVVADGGPSVLGDQSRWDWKNGQQAGAGGGQGGSGDGSGDASGSGQGRGTWAAGGGNGAAQGGGARPDASGGAVDSTGAGDGYGTGGDVILGGGTGGTDGSRFGAGGRGAVGGTAGDRYSGTSTFGTGGAGTTGGPNNAGGQAATGSSTAAGSNATSGGSGSASGVSGEGAGGSSVAGGSSARGSGSSAGGSSGGTDQQGGGSAGGGSGPAMPGLAKAGGQAGGAAGGQAGGSAGASASMAQSRGKNWASLATQDRPIPLTRPIRVECSLHELRFLDDSGRRVENRLPVTGDTADAIDSLVATVHARVERWGIAGDRMYWKPELVLSETADGRSRREDLERLLAESGIDTRSGERRDQIRPLPPINRTTAVVPAR